MGWQFGQRDESLLSISHVPNELPSCREQQRVVTGPVAPIAVKRATPISEIGMPLIATLVFLLTFAPSIALTQDIPEYDSEAHCKRITESAAKPSATLGRCLWLEEYALDELETFWPRASGAIREECLEIASAEESYLVLARCVMARLRRSR